MRKDYQIFVFFALISVVFIGYWAISGISGSSNSSTNNGIVLENGQANGNSPYIQQTQTSQSSGNQTNPPASSPDVNNLTDKLSGNIASEFLSKVNFKKATTSQGLIDQINSANSLDIGKLTEQLGNNPLGLISSINKSDILTTSDNSLQSLQSYGQQYSILFSQATNSFTVNPSGVGKIVTDAVSNGNSQELDNLTSDLVTGYDKIIGLKAPTSLLLFHQKTLIFLKNSGIVFSAIKNGENDPIKAYLAVTDGATEIGGESQELVALYGALAKQYKF